MNNRKSGTLWHLDPIEQFSVVSDSIASGHLSILHLSPLNTVSGNKVGQIPNKDLLGLLAILDTVEEMFHKLLRPTCQVYMLGSEQLTNLFELTQCELASPDRHLEVLHGLSLCYVLACSPKFSYANPGLRQFRISGWGRKVVTKWERHTPSCQNLSEWLEEKIVQNIGDYRDLIYLCSRNDRPLETQAIHALNRSLPLRIVT